MSAEPASSRSALPVDLLFSVSLANLAMINVWGVLLYASAGDRYFLPEFGVYHHLAALLLLVALSAAIGSLRRALRGGRSPLLAGTGQILVLAALLSPVEYLRESFGVTRTQALDAFRSLPAPLELGVGLLAVVLAATAIWQRRLVARAVFVGVLILSPLALGNAVQTLWHALSADGLHGDAIPQHAPRGPGAAAAVRVVWIVFDELDYRLAFEDRPAWIDLPEFDALRGESFFATHAIEASSETGTALSSLLLGRPVHTGVAAGATELMLRLDPGDAQAVSMRELPNFFTRVREMSLRLGIVGIYHPYCRLFPDVYAECVWEPFLPGGGLRSAETFTGVLLSHAYKLLPVLYYRGEHIASAVRSVAAASAFAADPELDVVFIHLPIPHPPYIYDAAAGDFTLFNFSSSAYIEQLALADRALGEIRRAMEESGVWRSSALLVTSDHGWRFASLHGEPRDHRVPFLLKLAGEPVGFEYEARFPSWRAAKLLRGVLTGGVARPDEIAAWLDARGTAASSSD